MAIKNDIKSRKALGRGLAALIAPPSMAKAVTQAGTTHSKTSFSEQNPTENTTGLKLIPIEKIVPNKKQPRTVFAKEPLEELAESIKVQGVIQPIIVRKVGNSYQIVAGERRWRATALAGLAEIPALVKELADDDALQIALVENIQRQDLDPLEEAQAYRRLVRDFGHTQDEVAKAVGKSRAAVTNTLRLLNLPRPILDHLEQAKLTPGHARAIMSLKQEQEMCKLAEMVVKQGLSVRDTENRAKALKKSSSQLQKTGNSVKNGGTTPAERKVEERLMRVFGTRVALHQKGGKGHIEIFFHTLEQLDTLLAKVEDI